jgi:hypothetical protein
LGSLRELAEGLTKLLEGSGNIVSLYEKMMESIKTSIGEISEHINIIVTDKFMMHVTKT